jgi:hypothetical protein
MLTGAPLRLSRLGKGAAGRDACMARCAAKATAEKISRYGYWSSIISVALIRMNYTYKSPNLMLHPFRIY